jgi:hypothetical protein
VFGIVLFCLDYVVDSKKPPSGWYSARHQLEVSLLTLLGVAGNRMPLQMGNYFAQDCAFRFNHLRRRGKHGPLERLNSLQPQK